MRSLSTKQQFPEMKYRYFLQGVLPEGHMLVFNQQLNILSYLRQLETLHLPAQEQFTPNECSLLIPLLEDYPHYCSHEKLYANLYYSTTNEDQVILARRQLDEAALAGRWEDEIRGIRNVLSRVRQKLKMFSMSTHSVLDAGYLLVLFPFGESTVTPEKEPLLKLMEREKEILLLMAQGQQSNLELARTLGITPKTVGHIIANLNRKLQAPDREQAVSLAQKAGLI